MSFSRDDFKQAIAAEILNHPLAAQYFQAGDPRFLAQLDAMATMLAMVSSQIDVESVEPFIKTRDTTILADAMIKGILPFARPARATLQIVNTDAANPVNVAIGRRIVGDQGRVYVAESAANISPGATGMITVKQVTTRQFSHTVANSIPFYSVQIPPSTDSDLHISGVLVSIGGVSYPYTPEFSNVAPNQPAFTLETDEQRRMFAKFGWRETFGIQPSNGAVIQFTIEETAGQNTLAPNAAFTFESTNSAAERAAKITLSTVLFPGSNPLDIVALREFAQYPSTYDSSAVYLGNFDFLIRRNVFPLRFLSVWNEQIEEAARGPSVGNINKLFVAALMDGASPDWLRAEITKIIRAADDSYRIAFMDAIEVEVPVTINAQVPIVYDPGSVENQIRAAVAGLYGRDSVAARGGMLKINSKLIGETLRKKVPALLEDSSDFQVTVPGTELAMKPEHFRYVSDNTLIVNVTQATYNAGLFSH